MKMFGVIGTSTKENERRIPIHPDHLSRIPDHLSRRLVFEEGTGFSFARPTSFNEPVDTLQTEPS